MRPPVRGVVAALTAGLVITLSGSLAGCARFDDAQSQPFTTEPELTPPPTSTPPPPPPLPGNPFPKACPAPGVMQGCLESTSGLIMGDDSKSALVAERTTGVVKEVSLNAEPKVKTVIPVDGSGDGGLLDIVLSPTYQQDRLMYAYISTATDNRVVRIADDDIPKEILTGIPKGATGNTGSLIFTSPTTLLVQTGDAGNPALAGDPGSLAGKVLRIEQPTTVNQAPLTTALTGHGCGRRNVHRPVRRFALHHRPHPHGRSPAAHHEGIGDLDGVDMAGQARRGRLRRDGRHDPGQPGQHQADRGGAAGAGDGRGHRRARGDASGPARPRLGASRCRRTETSGAQRSTEPPGTPTSSTTWCSRCSRRAGSRAATPT